MKLINADCIAAMKEMHDNSVHSIVTDPPYELGFMGKAWDASGIAFNIEVWKEALRILKPGGHLIAFSGSRTYHRMAVAIEDAGFEIRDQIMWVYGSGFPKSHNVSKGIDKAAGAEREVVGTSNAVGIKSITKSRVEQGYRKNLTVANERETIDITAPATDAAKHWDGWGTALKPAHEPIVLARKPLISTVANNVLKFDVGALNIDATRVAASAEDFAKLSKSVDAIRERGGVMENSWKNSSDLSNANPANQLGRWPANFIHDGSDEVLELFPQSGKSERGFTPAESEIIGSTTFIANQWKTGAHFGDSGSAARFFYCAKASKRDRNEGTLNNHPTVKPTSLMQYLVKLVTPPNGTVLDPFMGSGSTGKACAYEGFDFIGIDQSAEYVEIAQARIDFALEELNK